MSNLPIYDPIRYGDDDEEEEEKTIPPKDATIFLLDLHKSMYIPTSADSDETPMSYAWQFIFTQYYECIVSRPNNFLAIIFFGTERLQTNNSNLKNIHVFKPIGNAGVDELQTIKNFTGIKSDHLKKKIDDMFGISSKEHINLSEVLWCAQTLFQEVNKLGYRVVKIITARDEIVSDDTACSNALKRVKQMAGMEIRLDAYLFKTRMKERFTSKFWEMFKGDNVGKLVLSKMTKEMLKSNNMKEYKKRNQATLRFQISEEQSISVMLYSLVSVEKRPGSFRTYEKDQLNMETTQHCVDTATEILDPRTSIVKTTFYGGERVILDQDEMMQINTMKGKLGEKGLKLLGFKPMNCLKEHHSFRNTGFLYPSNKLYKNSTVLFAALHRVLMEKKMFALCRFKRSDNGMPFMVALIPQESEEYDEMEDEEEEEAPRRPPQQRRSQPISRPPSNRNLIPPPPPPPQNPKGSISSIVIAGQQLQASSLPSQASSRGSSVSQQLSSLGSQRGSGRNSVEEEEDDDDNEDDVAVEESFDPPGSGNGFMMIYLPYADGIRDYEGKLEKIDVEDTVFSDLENTATERLVDDLMVADEFSSASIPNPSLQQHYHSVMQIALQQEPDKVIDSTLPNMEVFKKKKKEIEAFQRAFKGKELKKEKKKRKRKPKKKKKSPVKKEKKKRGKKRKRKNDSDEEEEDELEREARESEPPKKKRKISRRKKRVKKESSSSSSSSSDSDDSSSEEETVNVSDLGKRRELHTLSKDEMVEFMKSQGLDTSGKKRDRIMTIRKFLLARKKIKEL